MKFLQELVSFKRMNDDQEDDTLDDMPLDDESDDVGSEDFGDEPPVEDDLEDFGIENEIGDEEPSGEFDDMGELEDDLDGTEDMPDEPAEPEDPDRAGLIRTVNKAHLVYKRTTDDGTYEEMWMYNISNLRDEISIRKAILSGTDIPPTKTQSEDGSQSYELWTAGNAEMMVIKGLPQ